MKQGRYVVRNNKFVHEDELVESITLSKKIGECFGILLMFAFFYVMYCLT